MAGAQRAEVGQCGAGGGGGGAPAVPGLQSTVATLATLVLAPCHGYTLLPTALSCKHPSGSHFSNVDFVLYEQKM